MGLGDILKKDKKAPAEVPPEKPKQKPKRNKIEQYSSLELNMDSQEAIAEGRRSVSVNTGRFYITSPNLIRTPHLDQPFRVGFALEGGQRAPMAIFQIKTKSSKNLIIGVGAVFAISFLLILWLYFNAFIIAIGVALIIIIVSLLIAVFQKPNVINKEVPFDYSMAIPQQNGGVEAAFDALTYLQLPLIQVSKEVMDKIYTLEASFTNQMESINAVATIKESFMKKEQSWWQKNQGWVFMAGFTILCLILIMAGMYLIGQQQISSWTTAQNNFLSQWGSLASKLTGIPLGHS